MLPFGSHGVTLCWLLGTSVCKSGSLLQYNISLLSLSLVHICNCRENREQTFSFSVNVHADASARQQEHAVFVCYVRENAGNYLTTNSCSGAAGASAVLASSCHRLAFLFLSSAVAFTLSHRYSQPDPSHEPARSDDLDSFRDRHGSRWRGSAWYNRSAGTGWC